MRRNLAVLALLTTAALAACGVSRGSSADDVDRGTGRTTTNAGSATSTTVVYERSLYVTSLASVFSEDTSDIDQATCVAEGVIDALGVDRLVGAGVVPGDLDDDEDFLTPLDLSPAEEDALGDAVAKAFLECGATEQLLRETFEEESPGAVSDESARCAAEALTPLFGDSFIAALKDPDVDMDAVSQDAIAEVLAACPTLSLDVMVSVAADDGYIMTTEEKDCLLREFIRLGDEHTQLGQDLMGEALTTCIDR